MNIIDFATCIVSINGKTGIFCAALLIADNDEKRLFYVGRKREKNYIRTMFYD